MTLKNDKERRAYVKDPANWADVDEYTACGNRSLRIETLNLGEATGVAIIIRVCGWLDPGYGLGERWVVLGAYEIVPETGALRSVYSLSVPQIAKRLKDLGL